MKSIIWIAVVVAVLAAVFAARAGGDAKAARDRIAKGAKVIDVRTPAEYATGHLPGATNIPHGEIADRIAPVTTNKADNIVVYCRSGHRADVARKTLEGLGYTNVINGGGYSQLKD